MNDLNKAMIALQAAWEIRGNSGASEICRNEAAKLLRIVAAGIEDGEDIPVVARVGVETLWKITDTPDVTFIDDQPITPMPTHCTKWECMKAYQEGEDTKIALDRGLMTCPNCHASYGEP